jgi:uncharacterized protein (TIGR02300 family)
MPPKDLGTKHACFKCQTKFYDMKKPVPLCPKCGADQRESPALKAPPPEKRVRATPRKVVPEVDPVEGEEEVPLAEDEDEAEISEEEDS